MNHMTTESPDSINDGLKGTKQSPYCDSRECLLERKYELKHNGKTYWYCPDCFLNQMEKLVAWYAVPNRLIKKFIAIEIAIETGGNYTEKEQKIVNEILKYSK